MDGKVKRRNPGEEGYLIIFNLVVVVKNKHNVGWNNLDFEVLAVIGLFKLKKNVDSLGGVFI